MCSLFPCLPSRGRYFDCVQSVDYLLLQDGLRLLQGYLTNSEFIWLLDRHTQLLRASQAERSLASREKSECPDAQARFWTRHLQDPTIRKSAISNWDGCPLSSSTPCITISSRRFTQHSMRFASIWSACLCDAAPPPISFSLCMQPPRSSGRPITGLGLGFTRAAVATWHGLCGVLMCCNKEELRNQSGSSSKKKLDAAFATTFKDFVQHASRRHKAGARKGLRSKVCWAARHSFG